MNIIKLNAINSTNDYLKELMQAQYLDNFTIVAAAHQTQGRGQMGSEWNVEAGKNLTFSILIKDLLLDISGIFNLNAATAVSIAEALDAFHIADICIKWPNDILAGNKKLGGILIENSIKNNGEIFSVVGIGLNVNQQGFDGLPKAGSLLSVTGREYDIDGLLTAIAENLKRNTAALRNGQADAIWEKYHKKLYKKNTPMPFEKSGKKFMGIIKGVTRQGHLEVLLQDDSVAFFNIKEVQMLY